MKPKSVFLIFFFFLFQKCQEIGYGVWLIKEGFSSWFDLCRVFNVDANFGAVAPSDMLALGICCYNPSSYPGNPQSQVYLFALD